MSRLLLKSSGVLIQGNSKSIVLCPITNTPIIMGVQSVVSGTLRILHSASLTTTTTPITTNMITKRTNKSSLHSSRRSYSSCKSRVGNISSSRITTASKSVDACSFSNNCAALKIDGIRNMSMGASEKFLHLENINPNFIVMEYAVRGPLVIRAGEIEKELKQVSYLISFYTIFTLYKLTHKRKRRDKLASFI